MKQTNTYKQASKQVGKQTKKNKEKQTKKNKQTAIQTDRQTDRQTDKQTNRKETDNNKIQYSLSRSSSRAWKATLILWNKPFTWKHSITIH